MRAFLWVNYMRAGVKVVSGQGVGLSDGLYEELDEGCYRRLPTKSRSSGKSDSLGWAWKPHWPLRDRIEAIRSRNHDSG